jgi:hypothetical protein
MGTLQALSIPESVSLRAALFKVGTNSVYEVRMLLWLYLLV